MGTNYYSVFYDVEMSKNFLQSIFSNGIPYGSCMWGTLFARKKYSRTVALPSDKAQLKTITASNVEDFIFKVMQLEVRAGLYRTDGIEIPQEAIAFYFNPNLRSYQIASQKSLNSMIVGDKKPNAELMKNIQNSPTFSVDSQFPDFSKGVSIFNKNGNLSCEIDFSQVSKEQILELVNSVYGDYYEMSPHLVLQNIGESLFGKKSYTVFDYDSKDFSKLMDVVESSLNLDCVTLVETRGGYHLYVNINAVENQYRKTFHNKLKSICDAGGDIPTPLPGTYQGGFPVNLVMLNGNGEFC